MKKFLKFFGITLLFLVVVGTVIFVNSTTGSELLDKIVEPAVNFIAG